MIENCTQQLLLTNSISMKEGLFFLKAASKWKRFGFCLVLGTLFFLVPPPGSLSPAGWHVFGIFATTILGLILKPIPTGNMALLAIVALCLTGTLTLEEVLSGFSLPTIWLVVVAFFISRGIVKTGLGERIAYLFVERFGRKPLFLAYSLVASDLIIAPAMPSNAARAGGILAPIVQSLNTTFGSDPKRGTEKRLGNFLVPVVFQCDVVISAVFLTSMAANPMIVSFAGDLLGIQMTWGGWLAASCVPGILSLLLYPLVIYRIDPPELKETPEAPALAREKLDAMGPLKREEKVMGLIFLLLIALWSGGRYLGISETLTAFIGLCLLLLTGVLSWEDVKSEKGAWDTLDLVRHLGDDGEPIKRQGDDSLVQPGDGWAGSRYQWPGSYGGPGVGVFLFPLSLCQQHCPCECHVCRLPYGDGQCRGASSHGGLHLGLVQQPVLLPDPLRFRPGPYLLRRRVRLSEPVVGNRFPPFPAVPPDLGRSGQPMGEAAGVVVKIYDCIKINIDV